VRTESTVYRMPGGLILYRVRDAVLAVLVSSGAIGACASRGTYVRQPPSLDGVSLTAHAEELRGPASDTVSVRLSARNQSNEARDFQYGCTPPLDVYFVPMQGDGRQWKYSEFVRSRIAAISAATGLPWVCVATLYIFRLNAGSAADTVFLVKVAIRDVLGDSLPAGRYRVSALLMRHPQLGEIPAGELELRPSVSEP